MVEPGRAGGAGGAGAGGAGGAGGARGAGRPDLSRPRRIHLVGVGGSGMSAIATVLAGMGHRVSGSDAAGSAVLDRLARRGLDVHGGHDPAWVDDAEVIAISTAIPAQNVEVREALRRGMTVWRRSQLLAAICARRRTVAVSGSHGKTTTSAMLALVLRDAGLRPSMIVGGDVAGAGSGAVWDPAGEWLVVEADESDGTFVELGAEAVVVTSVGSDHADFYGGTEALREAFVRFVREAPGPVVLCADDPGSASLEQVVAAGPERVVTYGTAATASVRIADVVVERSAAHFSLAAGGETVGRFSLPVPGLHNVRNATAALATAHALGVAWEVAGRGLAGYTGVARRYEQRGVRSGVTYIDDYAHNPEKVEAALATARAGGWSRVVAVFQPHRYSRTEALWRQLGEACAAADVLLVTDVYPAGERPRAGVSGRLVADAARAARAGADVRYEPTLEGVARALRDELRPGDLCITLGAGDVTTLAASLLGEADADG